MKEWLTALEIAEEKLPFLPTTKRGVAELSARENWDAHPYARTRSGRGGGMEYRYLILPVAAQVAYLTKHKTISVETEETTPDLGSAVVSERARAERDARLGVLCAFDDFARSMQARGRTQSGALALFCARYNNRSIKIDEAITNAVPSISPRSLLRWKASQRKSGADALAVDRGAARKGTGVLDTANDGKVKAHILALIAHQPHLSADQVRTLCRAEFGDSLNVVSKGVEKPVAMPKPRMFQYFLKGLKETHKVELMKLSNPDRFRSTMLPSGTGMLRHVAAPNALWQIDASPVDALCTDGRHSVYVCIDIATRRFITYVSRTPRASAVGLLIRKAILAWGVPVSIKTDNGSDFTARETQRLFLALGIEADLSDAYSPAQKGHVERAIKTWQHQFASLLPGYVGHSVADRKAIEDRKSFADRLGQDTADAFDVQLSGADLQALSDEWCLAKYAHAAHAGLKGKSPAMVTAELAGTIRTVPERALDVLLMPVARKNGICSVTKFGIKLDHFHYRAGHLMAGQEVFVRRDPNDKGRIHVFSPDQGQYLGEAICPELAGIHPETFEQARKEEHAALLKERVDPIKAEIKRITKGPTLIRRALDVAARDMPNVVPLPKREERRETREIAAALDVGKESEPREMTENQKRLQAEIAAELDPVKRATAPAQANVQPLRTQSTPAQRFAQALDIRRRFAAQEPVSYEDAEWLTSYASTAEYKARMKLHEDFGDQAPVLRT